MDTAAAAQPKPPGGLSPERTPQVVVRAGKHFLCSACGKLVEVPAEVVGMLGVVPEPAGPPADSQDPVVQKQNDQSEVPSAVSASAEPADRAHARPSQASESSRQRVDGLMVPTPREMHRLLAWIDHRLRRLKDLQGEETGLARLRLRGPRRRPLKHAQEEDLGVALGLGRAGGRAKQPETGGSGRKRGGSWKRAVPLRGRHWGALRHVPADMGGAPRAGRGPP